MLQCVAVCCSALRCVAVCCGALQCAAVRCSVLRCVAVCCGVLRNVAEMHSEHKTKAFKTVFIIYACIVNVVLTNTYVYTYT